MRIEVLGHKKGYHLIITLWRTDEKVAVITAKEAGPIDFGMSQPDSSYRLAMHWPNRPRHRDSYEADSDKCTVVEKCNVYLLSDEQHDEFPRETIDQIVFLMRILFEEVAKEREAEKAHS